VVRAQRAQKGNFNSKNQRLKPKLETLGKLTFEFAQKRDAVSFSFAPFQLLCQPCSPINGTKTHAPKSSR
jgi:hypothetical protein